MRLRSRDLFQTVHSEGGLLPADLLQRVADGDSALEGLKPSDYHLDPGERLGERITRAWTRLTGVWAVFDDARQQLPPGDAAGALTRERWLQIVFDELGYGRLVQQPPIQIDEKPYPIFTQWQNTPIHLVGAGVSLDRRTAGVRGAAVQSPHGLVQELLNRSPERLWGLVSNGLRLRVLRDNVTLTRQAYVEFDLEAMFTGEVYSDFVLLWLVCHQSRVEATRPAECWLELWTHAAADSGTRALDALRQGVEAAIERLGAGFLAHPANRQLHDQLRTGELEPIDYYRTLLRLVYRLLFLFVAEDRNALLDPNGSPIAKRRYVDYYSTAHLRELASKRRGSRHHDCYEQLKLVMNALNEDGSEPLALPALGSYLWEPAAIGLLADAQLSNEDLFGSVRSLATVEHDNVRRSVDFRNLGAEELGSVYESLLELHPTINRELSDFKLNMASGSERKTTGSYYTPTSLINSLLDTALNPVLDEAARSENPEAAILALAVVDPACGSGHFLIAAANRIARRLAAARSGDPEPAPIETRTALRDVIGHCIHGVDMNPMAVELCKVSLWMEAVEPGCPLSFLDHKIVLGNSLVGTTPALIAAGIPDDAFKSILGDDKPYAVALRKRNEKERSGQLAFSVAGDRVDADVRAIAKQAALVDAVNDRSLSGVRQQQKRFDQLVGSVELRRAQLAADTWCAAFVAPKREGAAPITTDTLSRVLSGGEKALSTDELAVVAEMKAAYSFLHWHVAFPDVWEKGGFDVVLGNPPWDRLKPEPSKYFAASRPDIADASTAVQRAKLMSSLETEDPRTFAAWSLYERRILSAGAFLVRSGLFSLTATGKFNLGSTFLELALRLAGASGMVGMLNISGIATDDSGKVFIADVMNTRRLVSFFDFENRDGIFPGVDRRYRFCAITLAESDTGHEADFVFLAHSLEDLADPKRHIRLSESDVRLLNPISRNCPVFRDARQADMVKMIYRRAELRGPQSKVLFRWDADPTFLFVMSDHSRLFTKASELDMPARPTLRQLCPVLSDGSRYLPLYEAKMFHQFDHRWARITEAGAQIDLTDGEHDDPACLSVPRYWMKVADADIKLAPLPDGCLLAVREVTNASNERTTIASVIPRYPVGHNAQVLAIRDPPMFVPALLANLNSFCLDFAARAKVGGSHLSSFILRQLPILPRASFEQPCEWDAHQTVAEWIVPRALELTFTSGDLSDFASGLGYEGPPFRWDPKRRAVIRAELDAMVFRLYGVERDDVDYIMETFPIVKRHDEERFGEFRTKRLILERYDAMAAADAAGASYETPLDPPPGDPRAAHTLADGSSGQPAISGASY